MTIAGTSLRGVSMKMITTKGFQSRMLAKDVIIAERRTCEVVNSHREMTVLLGKGDH